MFRQKLRQVLKPTLSDSGQRWVLLWDSGARTSAAKRSHTKAPTLTVVSVQTELGGPYNSGPCLNSPGNSLGGPCHPGNGLGRMIFLGHFPVARGSTLQSATDVTWAPRETPSDVLGSSLPPAMLGRNFLSLHSYNQGHLGTLTLPQPGGIPWQ